MMWLRGETRYREAPDVVCDLHGPSCGGPDHDARTLAARSRVTPGDGEVTGRDWIETPSGVWHLYRWHFYAACGTAYRPPVSRSYQGETPPGPKCRRCARWLT